MSLNRLEALRAFRNEAQQLFQFADRLYSQEDVDSSEVSELDIMLADCIDALSTLEDTVTEEEAEEIDK